MITSDQLAAGKALLAASGYAVAPGAARSKFEANEGLKVGTYVPEFGDGVPVPAIFMPARRGGSPYAALSFKCDGRTVKVSVSSFFNSIRVVEGMSAAGLAQDAKWAGETVQPTASYFRYGSLSNMESADVPNPDGDGTVAVYKPQSFTLTTEVVYVAPRFVAGSNQPIFDEQCTLRKAVCVAEYKNFPDANARR